MRSSKTLLALGLMTLSLTAQTAKSGLTPAHVDPTVAPCANFFQYANGTWLKTTTIPADKSGWGVFDELFERNREVVHRILEETAQRKDIKPGSNAQKIRDFYVSGMDEAAINRAGVKPLALIFARIHGLKDRSALAAEVGRLHIAGTNNAFIAYVNQDDKDSSRYAFQLTQGGLGMPDRDYYTKDDADSKVLREKYVAHVAKMFELMGDKAEIAKAHAAVVMALETTLAKASKTRVELRDPESNYHKMDGVELIKQAPGFAWQSYFHAVGLKDTKGLIVGQPEFMKAFAKLAGEATLDQWKTYLRWHLIRANAGELSSDFVQESFEFNRKTLTGAKEMEPRWKRVQNAADNAIGEALGELYVAKAFSPKSKAKAQDLVKNLMSALKDRIEGLEWMSAPTKTKALEKLSTIMVKIGYPDRWRDYSAMKLTRQAYVLNSMEASRFEFQRQMDKLGKPIDRAEWGMTPPTVNAYYNPNLNEIVFPAGILQAPFFDAEADDAVNYGAIGMVIGHELTHGFDDQGRQYDAQGNLKDWWTKDDAKAYEARTDLMVKQYDAFEPLPGLKINGKLTLGENIADLGGLKIAFAAFKKATAGKPTSVIDGFTPEQRFFMGYAQSWHSMVREQAAKLRLNTDPHSPAKYRVNGPLSNLPEFFEAFGCKDGESMKREEKTRPAIW
jgi:putative endopeptidase